MKTISKIIPIVLIVVCLLCGCKSTPDTVAFKVVKGTDLTIEEALGFWDTYIAQKQQQGNPVPIRTEMQVKNAYDKYRKAMLVLADAGKAWTESRGRSNESIKESAYQLAFRNLESSKADIFSLLDSFGVSLVK